MAWRSPRATKLPAAVWGVALLLAWPGAASAQTDALVVDDSGRVGVIALGPNESLSVTVALQPSYVRTPRRCGRGPVPVRIAVSDAETGEVLVSEEALLSAESRQLTATLEPSGGAGIRVQAAVLTPKRTRDCVASGFTASGPAGFRTLAP